MSASFLARLPLSRQLIDRDHSGRRNPELAANLRADPRVRAVVLWRGSALLADREPRRLALLPLREVPSGGDVIYLGQALPSDPDLPAKTPMVVCTVDDAAAAQLSADPSRWAGLRTVAAELSDRDAGLFTQGLAILNWHESAQFSPRTGEPTVVAAGGWVRHPQGGEEESSGAHVFPRTDPAVIVGVTDAQDRLLLGRNALWEPNRFSLLAGFVEPGESLEAAVEREVFEESGVHIVDPVYLGSQPWPFPGSVMIGFTAHVDPDRPTGLHPDGTEILSLRWFSRQELRDARDEIRLPGRASIARAIIEHWYGGVLDAP